MNTLRASMAAALLLVVGLACTSTPRTGAKTPTKERVEFTLPKPDGAQVTLSALKGKVVLVDMWATWCAPCKDSFPFYSQLQNEYRDAGLEILAVSVDEDTEAVSEFLAAYPVSFTVLLDPKGSLPEQLAIETMPTAILVDRQGKVAYMHAGFVPDDQAEIEARVKAALGLK